jgi:diguanylate cyclase (GGDEF)-like protein
LDLFTLSCITILNAYLSSGAMYFVSKLNGRTTGMASCAAAGFLMSTGFLLAPFSGFLPSHALNLVSNVLIFSGACLLVRGIRGFRGLRRVHRRRFGAVVAIYTGLFAYWTYGFDSLRARSIMAALATSALMIAAAWAMGVRVQPRDRPVYWTTASFYAATAIAAGLRGIWYFIPVPSITLFSPYPVDLLGIATIKLATIGGAFGLCLATNLRLIRAAEELALYDPLTNLPNRRLLEDRLAQAERRALSSGQPLALIYCDLDDFKKVNDRLGHAAGDRVLKTVASRLRGLLGQDACLARVGGDEFIVLVEHATTRKDLDALMNHLSNGVQVPIQMDDTSVSLAISCGLALYPDDVNCASDLMRLADAAMYATKQQGRVASYLPQ